MKTEIFILTEESTAIRFECVVAKVQTLSDGGIRVWLDLSEKNIAQLAQMAECQRVGAVLSAEFTPVGIQENDTDTTEERARSNY